MKRKSSRIVLLLASAGLVAPFIQGCSDEMEDSMVAEAHAPVKRDVYASMEECIADWGDKDLCVKAAEMASQQQAQQSSGGTYSNGAVVYHHFYGPEYSYSGDRYITRNGQIYRPTSNSAVSSSRFTPTPQFVQRRYDALSQLRQAGQYKPNPVHVEAGKASLASRGMTTGSVARGGFGKAGASMSSGG
jgi:uncharacterized protein YgiB involved in biofilm formation